MLALAAAGFLLITCQRLPPIPTNIPQPTFTLGNVAEKTSPTGSPNQEDFVPVPLTSSDPPNFSQTVEGRDTRLKYQAGQKALLLEFLAEDIKHVEMGVPTSAHEISWPILFSVMIVKQIFSGPAHLTDSKPGVYETSKPRVAVDAGLCIQLTHLLSNNNFRLTTLCPQSLERDRKSITLTPESFTDIYGLGQQFLLKDRSNGNWTGKVHFSSNPFGNALDKFNDRKFELPVFALGGAILPEMYVDDQTYNALGMHGDGKSHDELIVRGYPGMQPSQFTLYEDDGKTIAYQKGESRLTEISQQSSQQGIEVKIVASQCSYQGTSSHRDHFVKLVIKPGTRISEVNLNDTVLTGFSSMAEFDAASSGWIDTGGRLVLAKSGQMDVGIDKTFIFK